VSWLRFAFVKYKNYIEDLPSQLHFFISQHALIKSVRTCSFICYVKKKFIFVAANILENGCFQEFYYYSLKTQLGRLLADGDQNL